MVENPFSFIIMEKIEKSRCPMTQPQQHCNACAESRIGEWDYDKKGNLKTCFCTKHNIHICLEPPVIFDLPVPDCHSSRPAPDAPKLFRPTGCVGVCAVMPERLFEHDAAIAAQAREEVPDERIRDIELIISLCKTLRHHFPDDISLQMTQEQHVRELKEIESLRHTEAPK
jgi:hypothetical protein